MARALILSAAAGVLTTFLLITGIITLSPVFLWVAFGFAAAHLLILTGAEIISAGRRYVSTCCAARYALFAGILGTILLSLVLLALETTAGGLVSSLLAGGILFFFTLSLTGTVCYVQCLTGCTEA